MTNRVKIDKNLKFPSDITKENKKGIHFIGLGGIGMSGLAKFLLELGYKVSGSDIKDGANMFSISAQGGTVFIGHDSNNVENASLVVVSSAIKETNPEIIEAKKRNIPIMHRSQILEALMSGLGLEKKQISIGVSGTHGKTSTTGFVGLILEDAKEVPSIVVGGQMPYLNTNSKHGKGKYFVAELDESDGTIEMYQPNYTIITNLEADHLDHYTDGLESLLNTFEKYVNNLKPESKIIVNIDDEGNKELLKRVNHQGVVTYSINSDDADYTVKDIKAIGFETSAKAYKNGKLLGEFTVIIPGAHNVSNALASIAVSVENGIGFEVAAASISRFTGMRRRFQVLGTVKGAKIVDDYAHHPTEVKATLEAAKNVAKTLDNSRVVAVFQPHRFTRLQGFWKEFAASFDSADKVYITDVYSAGEAPIEGICPEKFSSEINASYLPGPIEQVSKTLCGELENGDIVLTIGAGDITKLGPHIINTVGQ